MNSKHILLCLAILTAASCGKLPEKIYDKGVSLELAQFRAANYSDVRYALHFSIPESTDRRVEAEAAISLTLARRQPLILDFTGSAEDIKTLLVNGAPAAWTLENEHIVIPKRSVKKGENRVDVIFTAGDMSLNRRDEFLYTLLVPDRARTLFPCFDQPDLKARFTLSLLTPEQWAAVGNGRATGEEPAPDGCKMITFNETHPISTYLFSFVAGKFEKIVECRDGREISLYHRETDPAKTAQCGVIFDEVYQSLEWLEEYTGIRYPFEKYDLIILPGFQYGGMEHMGATLYNDRRMLLDPNPTDAELLRRSSLIAHETAHMWFGNFVTMKWFNDVWNKEVFANWFAARIVEPMYPAINHNLNFMISYFPSAYAEDRTGGAMPIQQHLSNLSDAGLIYSNIIYNKSPIVMDMLVRKVGEDKFRTAIREYLNTYAYGNTDWDGLVAILDRQTDDEDLRAWSNTWVKEKGMPTVVFEQRGGDSYTVSAYDPWGRGREWQQEIHYEKVQSVDTEYLLPNADGRGYGYFAMDEETTRRMLSNWGLLTDEVARLSALMNLYEGLLNLKVDPAAFVASAMRFAPVEKNFHIFNQTLSYAESCMRLFGNDNSAWRHEYEQFLFGYASSEKHPLQNRMQAMRSFYRTASDSASLEQLYRIWDQEQLRKHYNLGEGDMIAISYELAIRFPDRAEDIAERQLSRITNPDRRKEYQFVSQAVNPSREKRDEFFQNLLLEQNRQVEPWAATALRLLNHHARMPESLGYIRPGLDLLREIQRTGDIFFPANWCVALFGSHTSREALNIMEQFFIENPGYPPLLESKIRLSADHLYIINGELQRRYQIHPSQRSN
ncbi:MAG: M1 family aminopeptidase [Rikenellaceae bacterium]|nr:M1 family aminopeptidase [Rikenellaceae bacterium]MCL2693120.1 M1 family aminopeptidase [Rikenellaceae bacterium]